jgi:hypothetical protein
MPRALLGGSALKSLFEMCGEFQVQDNLGDIADPKDGSSRKLFGGAGVLVADTGRWLLVVCGFATRAKKASYIFQG